MFISRQGLRESTFVDLSFRIEDLRLHVLRMFLISAHGSDIKPRPNPADLGRVG